MKFLKRLFCPHRCSVPFDVNAKGGGIWYCPSCDTKFWSPLHRRR